MEEKNTEIIEEKKPTEQIVIKNEIHEKKSEKILSKKITIKSVICIILVLVMLIGSFYAGYKVAENRFAYKGIDNTVVVDQIKKCGDLIVIEYNYPDFYSFNKGPVPILFNTKFTMYYVANVKATTNLEKTKATVNNIKKDVVVKIPHAKIKEIIIDDDSVKLFDDSGSVFKHRQHEDIIEAKKKAKKKTEKKIPKDEILSKADQQTIKVIKKLLNFMKEDGYEIKVSFIEK